MNPLVSQQLKLVVYEIQTMAWKVCSPEHSLHVAVTMQNLELEITTTIHTNHDKCNDNLQIQYLLSDYGKYCMNLMFWLGVGIQITEQNELTLL